MAWLPVLAVGAIVLIAINRRAALYVIVLAIALSPEIRLGVPVRIEDLLLIVVGASWVAQIALSRQRPPTALDRVLIAYVVVGIVAVIWGACLGTAHFTIDKDTSAPFHLLKRVEFVVFFFILTDALRTARDVERFTYVFLIAVLCLNTFALMTFLSNGRIALAPSGAPVHEPGLASMLNVALTLSLIPAARGPAKLLLSVLLVFSVMTLPLGLGRNFIVSTVLIIAYVGLFQQRWVLALFPVLLMTWYLLPEHVIDRIATLQYVFAPDITGLHSHGAALISRVISPARVVFLALAYSPLFGFGLGSRALGDIDSEYAVQLFYTGLVGFAVFVLLGVCLFRLVRETRRAARIPMHLALANGFQLVLIAYVIYSVLSPSISAQRGGGFFFVVVSLLAALHRAVRAETAAQPERQAGPTRGAGVGASRWLAPSQS